jgi:ribosomal protein S18 acetylase RimI-like enzyme
MVAISPVTPADVSALGRIFQEMDEFYGESDPESAETKIRNIRSALFGDPPAAYALAAREGSTVVGVACYSFLWPAALTSRSLYLKELYISHGCRRSGIGRLLMAELFDVAADAGCTRVEWTTDNDNLIAQGFYENLGFKPSAAKLFYRADQSSFRILDSESSDGC